MNITILKSNHAFALLDCEFQSSLSRLCRECALVILNLTPCAVNLDWANFISAMDPRKHLKYSFSYKKLGFEPVEFKICLSSKVDKLLESFDLRGVETVKGKAINDVREQVCIQRSNQYLASRQREGRLFDFPHLTRYEDDIPEPNPVQRRQTRTKNKIRTKNYHEEQRRLFKDILRQEFQELFPFIAINEKGFLSSSVSGREMKATEFCNVIDEISANFLNKNYTWCTGPRQVKHLLADEVRVSVWKLPADITEQNGSSRLHWQWPNGSGRL